MTAHPHYDPVNDRREANAHATAASALDTAPTKKKIPSSLRASGLSPMALAPGAVTCGSGRLTAASKWSRPSSTSSPLTRLTSTASL